MMMIVGCCNLNFRISLYPICHDKLLSIIVTDNIMSSGEYYSKSGHFIAVATMHNLVISGNESKHTRMHSDCFYYHGEPPHLTTIRFNIVAIEVVLVQRFSLIVPQFLGSTMIIHTYTLCMHSMYRVCAVIIIN
jgi:hypothetical protein